MPAQGVHVEAAARLCVYQCRASRRGRIGLKILAVYPGTFDPIHFGHEDIIRRGASLFDELLVAVYDKPLKSLLFSPEDRLALVRASVAQMNLPNIRITG